MKTELKALGFSIMICCGLVFIFCGIYLMAGPLEDFEFVWKEIVAGIILLAIGLFCIIFTIIYSQNTSSGTINQ